MKQQYKQTEIGVIPEDWEITTLEKEYELFAGGDLNTDDYSDVKTSKYQYAILSNGLQNNGVYGFCSRPKYCGNAVTITGRGDIGHCVYRENAFSAIIRLLVCQPRKKINSKFISEYLESTKPFVFESTGVPQLTVPQIKNTLIPLPPFAEQNRIAEALSDIDELISSLEKLIAKKKAIKQGAMQQLLTGKTRLSGYTGRWKNAKWKDVLSGFTSGATPFRGTSEYFEGSIKWVSSGELNYNHITDTIEHISISAMKETNLTMHPAGTFLMAITGLEAAGTRGSCAILDVPATTNQSCMAIYRTEKMSTSFLYYYYVKNGNELAFQYCQGTKQQSYTAGIVRELPIYYPEDINEQNSIATYLSDIDNEIQSMEMKLEKTQKMKQGMMQQLLTGKIRLV